MSPLSLSNRLGTLAVAAALALDCGASVLAQEDERLLAVEDVPVAKPKERTPRIHAIAEPPRRPSEEAFAPATSAPRAVPAEVPAHQTSATQYRNVFLECVNEAGGRGLAIRRLTRSGDDRLLLVDRQSLVTTLDIASSWACRETNDEEQATTRLLAAVLEGVDEKARNDPALPYLRNAGLTHSKTIRKGVYVTSDLCPSRKPLDRSVLERLASLETRAPVALSITGAWIETHATDFHWLQEQNRTGRLAITWVNHSYTHPYLPGRPFAQNFLLAPGVDIEGEILDTERALIDHGETPSVFFRFPGLISNPALQRTMRRFHLATVGADAWLALGNKARDGSIVLIHPNGNEPAGLALLFVRTPARLAVPE